MAAEPTPSDDKAVLYLFGELNSAARAEFEAQLAESSELRSAVSEIEEAAIAITLCAPTVPAPNSIWKKIETEITPYPGKIVPIFSNFWRSGWAAAAACAIGWIFYALFASGPLPYKREKSTVAIQEPKATHTSPPVDIVTQTNLVAQQQKTSERQNQILRDQLVGLQRQISQLSQSVTQQQALLNESSRLKFMQVVPANGLASSTGPGNLSPTMQRALFLAMARELGWISTNQPLPNPNTLTNSFNIDIVDFRHGAQPANTTPPLQNDTKLQLAEKTVAASAEPTPAIVFSSGENAVVVVDPAVAPSGTELAIYSDSGELVGRTVISSSGAVVTVPNTGGGWTLHLQGSSSANGPSQVFQVVP